MKQRLLLTIIVLLAIAMKAQASIVIKEQVIDIAQQNIKIVGENADNNLRYTINNYEWADRGPQFQLVIEPIDNTKSAQFTSSDLTDQNYWEPLFRRITKEMAGQEMEAQHNIKKIFVKNVALLNNQFFDYEDNGYIQIESSGDFTIPDGCFSEDTHLKTFVCNVAGTLTLGSNVVSIYPGFTVKVYTAQSANAWKAYKIANGASFTVDDSEVVSDQKILSVTAQTTVNKDNKTTSLPNESGSIGYIEKSPTTFLINSFTATTAEDVTELFMDYRVYPAIQGSQLPNWKQVYATNKGKGVWEFSGPAIDILSGLQSNTRYCLEFSFSTNPISDKEGRAHYPTDGKTMSVTFTTSSGGGGIRGDLNNDGVIDMSDVMFLVNRILNGKFPDEK
jgi:hypothetical protein